MKKKLNKGITLVALVITIIVMLILAGVTLNITLAENGIIERTKQAKEKQENAAEKEMLQILSLGYITRAGTIDLPSLNGREINGYTINYTPGKTYAIATKEGEEPIYILNNSEILSKFDKRLEIIGQVDQISVGDYVEYNSNKNSTNTSWNGLWFVFYNDDSKGLQIVSTDYTELVELEGVNGVENGVETLINKCKEYVNREQGAIDGRILGAYGFGDNSYKVVNETIELGDRTIYYKGYNTGTTDDETSFGSFIIGGQLNLTAPVWVGGYSDNSNSQLPNWRAGGVKYCDLQLGNNPLTTDTLFEYDTGDFEEFSKTHGINPVILLDARVEITGGDGSIEHPWQISF